MWSTGRAEMFLGAREHDHGVTSKTDFFVGGDLVTSRNAITAFMATISSTSKSISLASSSQVTLTPSDKNSECHGFVACGPSRNTRRQHLRELRLRSYACTYQTPCFLHSRRLTYMSGTASAARQALAMLKKFTICMKPIESRRT